MLQIGRRTSRPPRAGRCRGFTLIELFLAVALIGGVLAFMVDALASLSRHLGRSELRTEVLSLAGQRLLEWAEFVRRGGHPADFPASGAFVGHPAFRWQAEISRVSLPDASHSELYELAMTVHQRGRPAAVAHLGVQGLRQEETLSSLESAPSAPGGP